MKNLIYISPSGLSVPLARSFRFGCIMVFVSQLGLWGQASLAASASATSSETRWSADLLNSVLRQDKAPPPTNEVKHSPSEASLSRTTVSSNPSGAQGGGLLLKTYQFRHLRAGAAGRSQSAVDILQKLLPPGSSIKPDIQANSIHVLTSASAHAAAWDFISAIDVPGAPDIAAKQELPPEVLQALKQLEQLNRRSETMLSTVDRVQTDLARDLVEAGVQRERALLKKILFGAFGFLLLLLAGVWVLLRRLRAQSQASEENLASMSPNLFPVEQIGSALAPMQKQMQQELMGVLNTAAIRMESWYNEQKTQREQLASTVAAASTRFEVSSQRLEANVQQLSVQHTRVEALAGELECTVRELDTTKDHFVRLQVELETKSTMLENTRERLSRKESELAHQQAKLAALTLILEEGAYPEDAGGVPPAAPSLPLPVPLSSFASPSSKTPTPEALSPSCPPQPTLPEIHQSQTPYSRTTLRFRFLPPDPTGAS